ncbi:hypothetical protein JSY36_05060 [Bacillus sp. H-16]|uniref:hypothetical protein n=1 Tax=Alteribacter salitolerans TaxID=2912333 RepID=UPI00196250B4|nr:hypothetical protein [Alteribacter salitolerans]MBM7095122.1 hypothetical protein [Alteribacter salitolerans]
MTITQNFLFFIGVTVIAYALVFFKGDDTRKKNFLKLLLPLTILVMLYLPSALINQEPPGYVQGIALVAMLSMILVHRRRLYLLASTAAFFALSGYYLMEVL